MFFRNACNKDCQTPNMGWEVEYTNGRFRSGSLSNLERNIHLNSLRNERKTILTDSQPAVRTLINPKVTSRLIRESCEEVGKLVVEIDWVYREFQGTPKWQETTKLMIVLDKTSSRVPKSLVRTRSDNESRNTGKIQGPSLKRIEKLLQQNMNRIKTINGDLSCRHCNRAIESAHHIKCKALDHRRQVTYGQT